MFLVGDDNKKIRAIPNIIDVEQGLLPKHYRIGWLISENSREKGIEYVIEENVKKSRGHFWVYRCSVYLQGEKPLFEIVSQLLRKAKRSGNKSRITNI
jgi:hypothetical protein